MKIKKIVAVTISAVMLLCPCSCLAAENENAPTAQTEETAQTSVIFDSDAKKLEYVGCLLVNDYQGAATALLVLTYTNKTATANSPIFDYFQTVFQNGVSLNTTVISDPNYSAYVTNQMTQVKDGASITYAVPYLLNDTVSGLEVEFKDSIYGGNSFKLNIDISTATADVQTPTEAVQSDEDWKTKYDELLEEYKILEEKYNALLSQMESDSE